MVKVLYMLSLHKIMAIKPPLVINILMVTWIILMTLNHQLKAEIGPIITRTVTKVVQAKHSKTCKNHWKIKSDFSRFPASRITKISMRKDLWRRPALRRRTTGRFQRPLFLVFKTLILSYKIRKLMNPRRLRAQIPVWKQTKHYQKKKKMKPRTNGLTKFKITWSAWEAICSACKRPWRTRSCCPSSLSCIWRTRPSSSIRRTHLLAISWWVTKRCARNLARILSWNASHGIHLPIKRESRSQTPPRRCSHSSRNIWTPSPP